MVEFALVLPIFCLLLFGIVQFGFVWNSYMTLTDATRAAARKTAVSRHLCADDATCYEQAGCDQLLAASTHLDPAATCDVDVPATTPGSDFTVRATYPYKIELEFIGVVLKEGLLKTETTERLE
jgi:Flp pilus assembly protein TadG